MKTVMEFEFNLPEDQEEFDILCRHRQLHSAAWDLGQWIRTQYKHGDYEGSALEMLERVRTEFYNNFGDLLE
jgi:hypothetical protein